MGVLGGGGGGPGDEVSRQQALSIVCLGFAVRLIGPCVLPQATGTVFVCSGVSVVIAHLRTA